MSEERKYLYIDSSGSSTNYLSYDAFYTIVKIMGSDDDSMTIERRLNSEYYEYEDFISFLDVCGKFCGCFKFEERENTNLKYTEVVEDIDDNGVVQWAGDYITFSIIYRIYDINRKALRLYIENYLRLLDKHLILDWPVSRGILMDPTIPEDLEKLFKEAGSVGVEMSFQSYPSWPSYALSFAFKNNLSLSFDERYDPDESLHLILGFGVNKYYSPPDIEYAGFKVTGYNSVYHNKKLGMGIYGLKVLRIILERSKQGLLTSPEHLVNEVLSEKYLDKVQVNSKNPNQAPFRYIYKIVSEINQQVKISSGIKDRVIISKRGGGYYIT